jgi:two-component system sensor histidine kinase RpfC
VEFEAVTGTAQLFSRLVVASERSRPFRTVIVERELLSMDAAQFADSLKKETTLANVSLILVDSRLESEAMQSLIMTGYSAVLYTPVNESLLFNAVHEACTEHQLSPGVASMADYFAKRQTVRSARVLVAEDNAVNQTVLRAILERAGHRVHIAGDGEEALDVLTERDTDFDIVILDMNMPKISGLDVLKIYRFMETEMNMPVIMLSADALPKTIEECRQAGADDYLTKPVDAKHLVEVIDKLSRPAKVYECGTADIQPFPAAKDHGRLAWHFIDLESLNNLKELSSKPDFIQIVLKQFIGDGEKRLAALQHVSSSNDQEAFLKIVHEFKGSAATAGVSMIAQMCVEAESKQRQELDRSSMSDYVARLAKVFQGSCKEIEVYLEQTQH